MKRGLLLASIICVFPAMAHADDSIAPSATIMLEASRVVRLYPLAEKPGLQVSMLLEDLGGSTDASPTQRLYLTLFAKGELCNYDAVYDLGVVYSAGKPERLSAGMYEIAAVIPTKEMSGQKDAVYRVDARNATMDIQKIPCREFDADSDAGFSTAITRSEK